MKAVKILFMASLIVVGFSTVAEAKCFTFSGRVMLEFVYREIVQTVVKRQKRFVSHKRAVAVM